QMVPVINTGLMRILFVTDGAVDEEDIAEFKSVGTVSDEVREASLESGRFSDKNFLDFDGDFTAEIRDEESRFHLNILARRNTSKTLQESPIALQLYGLMSGDEHDLWFSRRNLDRWELIANLADWVDEDNSRAGGLGGYEDNLYNNLDSPYLTKNAPFDSLEEVRQVEGWQDEVFERFEDQITVWGTGKININSADDDVLWGLLKAYVTPTPTDSLVEHLLELIQEYKLLANFENGKAFVNWLEGQGLEVDSSLGSQLTDSSRTFTITSTGLVGSSATTITSVVSYTTSSEGKVLFWRVD
ncbi:MAG: type II secretion system protein GspK, partial [Myxococcota bacterium]|nr:type II secretion system protein GspK [Myxococcota bacterium]